MRIVCKSIKYVSILATTIVVDNQFNGDFIFDKSYALGSPNRFEICFQNLIKEEGGYSYDPSDPGGETKYGISKRSYPHENIKQLTLERAAQIYKTDFYEPLKCEELPSDELARELLEQAVNMGSIRAVSYLQAAINASGHSLDVDGEIGKKTLQGAFKCKPDTLLVCMKAQALSYYRDLVRRNPVFKKYLKGWTRRALT